MSLIEVKALNSYYGDSHILFDVDMHVERNEVVALIGRNGAGKTTTLKSLMGIVRPSAGSVKFDGVELVGLPSHAIARAGMQLVHEERRIFGSLNVEQNLVLAGLTAPNRWPLDRVYEMFPRLKERRDSRGTDLSGGQWQRIALARALCAVRRQNARSMKAETARDNDGMAERAFVTGGQALRREICKVFRQRPIQFGFGGAGNKADVIGRFQSPDGWPRGRRQQTGFRRANG